MSDVVIRCPNCGTTQPSLGECEACHEADARYFCPNHAPGRWLDGPACAACGARFTGRSAGVPPTVPPMPSPTAPPRERARPPVDPMPTRPAPPRARRAPMPPPAPPLPPREPVDATGGWVEVDDRAPWPPARRSRRPREAGWPADIPIPTVRVGFGSVFGCLGRLVSAVVVLFVLAALAFFGYCGTPMGFDGEAPPTAGTPLTSSAGRAAPAPPAAPHAESPRG